MSWEIGANLGSLAALRVALDGAEVT